MRIVITGSTGMIGLALINLLKDKHDIIAVVRPGSKKVNNIQKHPNVHIIECDIANLLKLSEKIVHADLFFHLAWAGTLGIDARNDVYSQVDNIKYTLDAVKLAKNIGCTSFVGAGSQAEFGIKNKILTSKTPINPQTGYGIAKYAAGNLSRLLANNLGIKHCWTRILSVYGPGDRNTLIGSLIDSLLNNKPFNTTEGNQIWDYIYSSDCAEALYEIAINGKNNETYIIGSGDGKPLKEYIKTVRDIVNPEFNIGFGKRDYNPDQVMYLVADISKLEQDTNFKVKTSFEEGIKKTVHWFKTSK